MVWGVWAPWASVSCGAGAGALPFAGPGLIARVGPVRRRRRVLGGFAWCCLVLGGGGPPSSMDPPRRGMVAAAPVVTGRATVLGGVGPRGAPSAWTWWPGGYGYGSWYGGGGWYGGVAPGGKWGMPVERSVAAIPFAGAVRAQEIVARSGTAVGSGSGGAGVSSGGGGAAGGGGVASGGVGVACMAHGPLVGFPVPLVGVGGWASWAVPGAALNYVVGKGGGLGAGLDGDGGRGVPHPWFGLAGGGGGLRGMDDGALGDGDADEGLDGVVLGGRLCGGGGCRWEGGVGCGGWGVLAWVRVWVGVVAVGFVSLRLWCCVCTRGRRLGFGIGFGVGVRFQVEEDLCPEV